MPTEPDAFRALLDSTVQGSNSHEEAIFVAIGDLTRLGNVPPAVRAAAVTVATQLPHVTTTREGDRITVAFRDDAIRSGMTRALVSDAASSALVAERVTADRDGFTYASTTTVSGLVDAVPAEVLAAAVEEPVKPLP